MTEASNINISGYCGSRYWMERELKIKLGWMITREITRQFYQLVKEEFS